MMISRRSLFRGLGAILTAPPIAKLASLIPSLEARRIQSLDWLRFHQITRDAVKRFAESNSFLRSIEAQYDDEFAKTGAKIGSQLRIRLPSDYRPS